MFPKNSFGQAGFSLIEVLVAAFLIVVILASVMTGSFSSRDELESVADNIERAIRFSSNEATLRNKVIRIHFLLDASPQEYTVEFGPDGTFILPPSRPPRMSLADEERFKKETEKTNKQFNKIKEFEDENRTLSDQVRIIGIGSSLQEELVLDYENSIYIYPTGEKDSAIIIIGSDEEIIAIMVDPFTSKLTREYVKVDPLSSEEIIDAQLKTTKELFEKWLKGD